MCPTPSTCDQFVCRTDAKMYRERISISETAACGLLFVFLVTKVASFVAEDARGSGWCEEPGQTCSRCLESNAVRCSGIANARLRGDLCGCCASCVVDRKLGESCGAQLSARPLNTVDSWTAVLATSSCHRGLVCVNFVCRNLSVNEEPTVLTTRASVAVVQQIHESRISIGSLEDGSLVGEDDRANFLLGENVTPLLHRPANHDKVHTSERARSEEEARSNARFWRKLRTGLRKSQQETLTDVEASAYSATLNFYALTSPLGARVMQEDYEAKDSEIGVALGRKKLKAVRKALGSLGDGALERVPKSDLAVSIRCAVTEHLDNSTTMRIGDGEFRITHGMDFKSDLKVLLDAIDHSKLDSPRGEWPLLNAVSLLIDSVRDGCTEPSTGNELVGEAALSADWRDRSSHPFGQLVKTVQQVPVDPTSQESSVTSEDGQDSSTSSTVTNVTEDGQESSASPTATNVTSASPTATNVTSSVLQGHSSSSAKRPKRSQRGLDEDDYETNESVLRFDSSRNIQQLLSRAIEDPRSQEDSASPGIHSSVQAVSSLYPEDLVIFFDNEESQNRSANSVDMGPSLTKVTHRGRGSGVTKRMPPLAEKQNVSGDLNVVRALGNSPTSDDGRSSNGIPAYRIPKTSPKLGEAPRVNATGLAIDELFNRIETRVDGLQRRIEGGVSKGGDILRGQGPQDSREFVGDGHRGRQLQDSAEATLWNSTAGRRLPTSWGHPEDKRRPFQEQIAEEGVGRLEYVEKNWRQHREGLGDRGSRRVARHSIWSPKALRSLSVARNDAGAKTPRFCGQTQEIRGQGSADDYPQTPRTLEVLRLESPSTFEAEAFDSKRVVAPPWRLFLSGPDDGAKSVEEPAESRGEDSQRLRYAVTSRGNSSISIEDAMSGEQYGESHDDNDEDFDHMYESVEANDDEDWTMMASVDSLDRTDYFDGIGSHMAPVLLEIYGSSDPAESRESGIHPELAAMASTNGRTRRSASEDSVSFPNLHSPSDGEGSFGSPAPLVSPQRQKTRDPISRIWNSASTAELAASHRQTDSSPANFFQAIDA